LGSTPKLVGLPLFISATDEASDFTFDTKQEYGFTKSALMSCTKFAENIFSEQKRVTVHWGLN